MADQDLFDPKTGPQRKLTFEGADRPAPTHTRGIAATRTRTNEGDRFLASLLSGLEKALDVGSKVISSKDDEFTSALQAALTELVRTETTSAVGAMPFGRAILVAIEVSEAFALGAGEAIMSVNAKLESEYDFSKLSRGELTDEDIRLIQQMRGYQHRAVKELPGVLQQGLARVAEVLISKLFQMAEDTLKNAVRSVAKQVASQLVKQHDLVAIFNAAIQGEAERIPEARGRIERLAFSFSARAFLEQLGTDGLAKRVDPILKQIGSKEPLPAALLAGTIQVIAMGSYQEYSKRVPVAQGWSELRALLVDQARLLLGQTQASGVRVTNGPALVLTPDELTVPEQLWPELSRPASGPSQAERSRFLERQEAYLALKQTLRLKINGRAVVYQRRIGRETNPDRRTRLWERFDNDLLNEVNAACRVLEKARKEVVRMFGEEFNGYTVGLHFDEGRPCLHLIDRPVLRDEPVRRR